MCGVTAAVATVADRQHGQQWTSSCDVIILMWNLIIRLCLTSDGKYIAFPPGNNEICFNFELPALRCTMFCNKKKTAMMEQ